MICDSGRTNIAMLFVKPKCSVYDLCWNLRKIYDTWWSADGIKLEGLKEDTTKYLESQDFRFLVLNRKGKFFFPTGVKEAHESFYGAVVRNNVETLNVDMNTVMLMKKKEPETFLDICFSFVWSGKVRSDKYCWLTPKEIKEAVRAGKWHIVQVNTARRVLDIVDLFPQEIKNARFS